MAKIAPGKEFPGWRKIILRALRVFLFAYLGFGAFLFFSQRRLIYYPQAGNPEACPEFIKRGFEKKIEGKTVLYHKPGGKRLIVFYHGNAGTACDRDFLADYFGSRGDALLFVEYAGYGDGQAPSEAALRENVREADRFLEQLEFDELVLMGESLGTGLAVHHAVLHAPDKLILLAPFPSLLAVAAAHYPVYPVGMLIRDDYRTDWEGKSFPGKLLVIHGRKDDIVPFGLGEEFFSAAPFDRKEFFPVAGAGHNDLYESAAVWEKIGFFLF